MRRYRATGTCFHAYTLIDWHRPFGKKSHTLQWRERGTYITIRQLYFHRSPSVVRETCAEMFAIILETLLKGGKNIVWVAQLRRLNWEIALCMWQMNIHFLKERLKRTLYACENYIKNWQVCSRTATKYTIFNIIWCINYILCCLEITCKIMYENVHDNVNDSCGKDFLRVGTMEMRYRKEELQHEM